MKVCRLKTLTFIIAQAVLVILLLILLSTPEREELYPKSAHELEVIDEHLGDGDTSESLVNPMEDFLIPKDELTEQKDIIRDLQPKETVKSDRSTPEYKEPINQTQPKSRGSTTYDQQTSTSLTANNFTAEPKWSGEEDYIVVPSPHHTSCPISIKIKARNVPWLKERFLQDIILFMDGHHFSDEEWKRLRHFVPPFGWMGLEYSEVREAVSALPRVANQQLLLANQSEGAPHCISCAVVGNGGILNASRMGKEIDSHDYVFRVNGAMTRGHEDDVGNRTSFYGFTAFTMITSVYVLKRQGFSAIPRDKETKYILFTEGQRDYEWLRALQQNKELRSMLKQFRKRPLEDFENNFNFSKLLVAHPDFTRYLKNRILLRNPIEVNGAEAYSKAMYTWQNFRMFLRSDRLNSQSWRLYRPSTGALVLLTALHLCDTVSAYGFMTHDFDKYANHYYDTTKTKVVFYLNHDYKMEKDLWARLHEENIMKLYKGKKGL